MKRPWSISTTVRNPDRIRSFLEVLKQFEGKTFDEKQQVNFQIALIQNKLYEPTGLTEEQKKYYDSPEKLSLKQAKELFEHMKKHSSVLAKDEGLRGRTSIAPLSKMGLVISKQTIGKIYLTSLGKKFLKEDFDMGEIFLEYFFKWSLPNPDNDEFSSKAGFNIRPFIATIKIIDEVNKEWKSLGYDPHGLSKEEFCIFVPTTINYESIPTAVKEIIELRNALVGKDKAQQNKIKKDCFYKKINGFFEDSEGKDYIINFNNLKDYGDNIIRYFKITRFFHIRGGGFYFDLEPRRNLEIQSLLNYSNGQGLKFKDLDEYFEYLEAEPQYPWETMPLLKEIISNLRLDIIAIDNSLSNPQKVENLVILKEKLDKLSANDLKMKINALRLLRNELLESHNRQDLAKKENVVQVIEGLDSIFDFGGSKPIELEYLLTLGLHAINDALKIKPNYPVGDDNRPTFTAPANVPDIESYYQSFNLICEVTMLQTRDQWINEGQPVMRHLRDFEDKNKNCFCLFIAPRIHRDTFNTFDFANKGGYEGKKQRIIPLTIKQFIHILKYVLIKKDLKKPINQDEFRELLEHLYNLITKSQNLDEWANKSEELLVKNLK